MTIIASAGVVIAAAALFIVLSGFAGLKEFSLEFSSFSDPDLKIIPSSGKSFMMTPKNISNLKNIEEIYNYSKIVEERVVIKFDDKRVIASIKGVDSNYKKVTVIDSMIAQGNWFAENTNQVVAGLGISNNLSFSVLDYAKSLSISVPKPGKGQITSASSIFNTLKAINVGLFNINEDLDNKYIYSDISFARSLLNYKPNQVTSLEIKLNQGADEGLVRKKLLDVFNNTIIIKNREQQNDALYKMLNTENLIVYLIFTLVIIIALFNIIGAIIMMILDKKGSLQTLSNLGARTKDIKRVFFLQGSLMTLIAGIIGVVLGFLIVLAQQLFSLVMITPSFPYPVRLSFINVIIVFVTISILGVVASKIASSRITNTLVKT